jgi:hypothetical protein
MTSGGTARSILRPHRLLVVFFLLSLVLVNPWVRGDGVGYYAYVRSLLIDGDLRFENEWLAGNPTFVQPKLDERGRIRPEYYGPNGYVKNHFSVGPAMLWAPFLIVAHGVVLTLNSFGWNIPANGYSPPYTVTMAMATALYGFWGLLLSYRLAREYFEERWAFLGTVGIWFGSSLPVYMYFNPSWSHAHSAFVVALFLWYWHRTRRGRTPLQWMALGLLSGLMLNVYYPNGIVMLVPLLESLGIYTCAWKAAPRNWATVRKLFAANLLYLVVAVIAFLPTLITRWIIYGSAFETGYESLGEWAWGLPVLWKVLFSSNHGLFSWTPILLFAVAGLFILRRKDALLGTHLACVFLVFYYFMASYRSWDGISSFGNRFFVSLTPLFVLGLSALLSGFADLVRNRRAAALSATAAIVLFVAWNVGFIYQWGTHMIPPRGPISWRAMVYNQVAVVPGRFLRDVKRYLQQRGAMMQDIEQRDVKAISKQ